MASFRTQLALDRTTLAWIRTTLTMAAFGFGTVGFFRSLRQQSPAADAIRMQQAATWLGVGFVVLGRAAILLAADSHWFTLPRLRQGHTPVLTQWPLSTTVALLLAVIGLVALWTLMTR